MKNNSILYKKSLLFLEIHISGVSITNASMEKKASIRACILITELPFIPNTEVDKSFKKTKAR